MTRVAWFGERIHKARIEHFCYWCCEWIQPGETYTRKIWISGDNFHVMKEHSRPACKMFDPREEEEEPVRMMLHTVLETRIVEQVVLQRNGSSITRSEPTLVARTICVAESSEEAPSSDVYIDDDEEIPF